jgi:hypothetical protein
MAMGDTPPWTPPDFSDQTAREGSLAFRDRSSSQDVGRAGQWERRQRSRPKAAVGCSGSQAVNISLIVEPDETWYLLGLCEPGPTLIEFLREDQDEADFYGPGLDAVTRRDTSDGQPLALYVSDTPRDEFSQWFLAPVNGQFEVPAGGQEKYPPLLTR